MLRMLAAESAEVNPRDAEQIKSARDPARSLPRRRIQPPGDAAVRRPGFGGKALADNGRAAGRSQHPRFSGRRSSSRRERFVRGGLAPRNREALSKKSFNCTNFAKSPHPARKLKRLSSAGLQEGDPGATVAVSQTQCPFGKTFRIAWISTGRARHRLIHDSIVMVDPSEPENPSPYPCD